MIIYRINKNHFITAEKQKDGSYTIFNKVKNIFGSGYTSESIRSSLTSADIKKLKIILDNK